MLNNEQIADSYDRVADRIERGWTRGKWEDEDTGNVCALGATYAALQYPVKLNFVEVLEQDVQQNTKYDSVIEWNDVWWRRKYQVVNFMRERAVEYRKLAKAEKIEKLEARVADLERQVTALKSRIQRLLESNEELRNIARDAQELMSLGVSLDRAHEQLALVRG